jgi:hypothetical protein
VLETTSQQRAARGRAWLESLFGDRVRYRATALETLEQTMSELRSRSPRRSPGALAHVADEGTSAVRDLFDRHYRSWIDRPAPALGNRSPRAAARTTLWRPKLVDLLKQLENATERTARLRLQLDLAGAGALAARKSVGIAVRGSWVRGSRAAAIRTAVANPRSRLLVSAKKLRTASPRIANRDRAIS